MTLEREKALLTEVRQMAAMDKTSMSEAYMIPIESADDYFRIKAVAVIDTIIDGLNEEIELQAKREAAANAKMQAVFGKKNEP